MCHTQGVTIPSQRRYVEYFHRLLQCRRACHPAPQLFLQSVTVEPERALESIASSELQRARSAGLIRAPRRCVVGPRQYSPVLCVPDVQPCSPDSVVVQSGRVTPVSCSAQRVTGAILGCPRVQTLSVCFCASVYVLCGPGWDGPIAAARPRPSASLTRPSPFVHAQVYT